MGKIVHMTSLHVPYDSRILLRECRTLREAGHDVTFLAPGDRDDVVDGVRIRTFPKCNRRWQRMLIANWRLFRLAREEKADVCHFHDPELMLIGLVLKLFGMKVIYDVHEDMPRNVFHKHWIPGPLKLLVSWTMTVVEWLYQFCVDRIIGATPRISNRFIKRRSFAVRNLPMLDRHATCDLSTYDQRAATVVHVSGSNGKQRGLHEMIRAIELVAKRRPCELILAGNIVPDECRIEAQEQAGWQFVKWSGFVDTRDVPSFLSQGRVGLCVLHDSPAYREAYPVKIFEYMATGLPIIASDFPVWRELFRDSNAIRYVDPYDPEAIAREIEWIFDHPTEAAAMGRNGYEFVSSTLNWDIEQSELLRAYDGLLDRPPAQGAVDQRPASKAA
ncbi:MAG: glycosyltransferase family 4 protein [Planctomycetota bacterium]|nr:glycosyltransferase family 4 protein [Planctomycetota bacterium]